MTVETALIGVGSMGRRHLEVARDLSLPVVGICDVREEALAEAGKAFGIPRERWFLDAERLLADAKPTCVIVATTAPTHCRYSCLAARAGARFVLCEKPMAVSLAQCAEMLAVCDEHGTRLAVNHQMRFMPHYQEAKRIVTSEAFGGLTSVTVVGGNCGMAMNGLHYFEMFRFLTDEVPAEVTAWLSPDPVVSPRGPEFEDRAGSVRLTTASGRRFYAEIGADQGHGLKVICAGPCGQLVIDELAGTLSLSVRQPAHRDEPMTRYALPTRDSTVRTESAESVRSTAAVLSALLTGNDAPTGRAGRLAVTALVAAYISHEQGHRAVRLGEELPYERTFRWA
ncbi:MAG: Gfo/Idh/MocA family oxidoreductase [Vicinamibacterales bacterium]|jgi:predicted dehydrogenase|nr:Gfo/Idh/MocA family oxidoreductase [Vicinamibacterales bacterium]